MQNIKSNDKKILELYEKAKNGDMDAQNEIGTVYSIGIGVEKNDSEALKWFKKSAERGFAAAQYNLGLMYMDGIGIEQNDEEAIKWYKKAAEQGDVNAQNNLIRISRSRRKETSGCFIATAVYNSPTAPKVMILREFRDQQLLTSKFGSLFVQLYYRNSPPIANFLSQNKFFSEMVRIMMIEPLVYVVKLFFGGINKKVK